MNEFNYHNRHLGTHQPQVVSRVDLWASAVVLAVFAVAFGSTAFSASSLGDALIRGLLAAAFLAGASIFFRAALLWNRPRTTALEYPRVREIRGSFDKARSNRNSRAA